MNTRTRKHGRLSRAAAVVAIVLCLFKTAPGGFRPVVLVDRRSVAARVA